MTGEVNPGLTILTTYKVVSEQHGITMLQCVLVGEITHNAVFKA